MGWGRLDLTFSIGAPPTGVTAGLFRQAVASALDIWRQAVPFRFSEASDGILRIEGVPGEHGDGLDFISTSDELAHSFFPGQGAGDLEGRMHLNNFMTFGDDDGVNFDILTIVLHEMGHALGIADEFDDPAAVMHGGFERGVSRRELTALDRTTMRGLYAAFIT